MSNQRHRDHRDRDMRRGDRDDDLRRANPRQFDSADMESAEDPSGGSTRRSGGMSMPGSPARSRKKK